MITPLCRCWLGPAIALCIAPAGPLTQPAELSERKSFSRCLFGSDELYLFARRGHPGGQNCLALAAEYPCAKIVRKSSTYTDQMILHSLAPEIDQAYRWLSGF
jgi:hypothetical protein